MVQARITLDVRDEFVVAGIHGEIDLFNVRSISDSLVDATSNVVKALLLDLSSVTYLDSAGLKLLFELARRLEPRRQRMGVVVPEGSLIGRIVRLSNIAEIIPVMSTVDEGLSWVSRPRPL
jgi:anti-anti-sigma factor